MSKVGVFAVEVVVASLGQQMITSFSVNIQRSGYGLEPDRLNACGQSLAWRQIPMIGLSSDGEVVRHGSPSNFGEKKSCYYYLCLEINQRENEPYRNAETVSGGISVTNNKMMMGISTPSPAITTQRLWITF